MEGDGKLDLIVGAADGTLKYYLNSGSSFVAQSGGSNPFNAIDAGDRAAPTFADVNGDGQVDLVVGAADGTLKYYLNNGKAFIAQTGADNPFNDIDAGDRSTPNFADLSGDGKLDLVVGSADGTLKYYLNNGTTFIAQTGANNPFNGIDVGENSTPNFVDFDGDNRLDLIVGTADGSFKSYLNIPGVLIREGETSASFEIAALNDNIAEDPKSLNIQLLTGQGYRLSEDATKIQTSLEIVDDSDVAGVILTALETGTITSEAGADLEYSVQLSSQPTAPVTVYLGASEPDEAELKSIDAETSSKFIAVEFTPDNWNQPQNVTIVGIDDSIDDGDVDYQLITTVISEDLKYNELIVDSPELTNTDDDLAGISINLRTDASNAQEGTTNIYTVKLNSQPLGEVLVTLIPQDDGIQLNGEKPRREITLAFDEENWNQEQLVRLNAVDDNFVEYQHSSQIFFKIESQDDPVYNQPEFTPEPLQVQIQDNDLPTVKITPGWTASELQGAASGFAISLSQPVPKDLTNTGIKVNYELIGGTGLYGEDYQPIARQGSVTIAPGEIQGNLLIVPIDDKLAEGFYLNVNSLKTISNSNAQKVLELDITSKIPLSNNAQATAPQLLQGSNIKFPGGTIADLKNTVTLSQQSSTTDSITYTGKIQVSVNSEDAGSIQIGSLGQIAEETVEVRLLPGEGYELTDNNTEARLKIIDDDIPGVRVIEFGESTTVIEGETAIYQISLLSQPQAPVTITLVDPNNQISFANSSLTFTADNWYQLQTVTVEGIDEGTLEDGDFHTTAIKYTVSSNDPGYDEFKVADQTINVIDRVIDSEQAAQGLEEGLRLTGEIFNNLELPLIGSPEGKFPSPIEGLEEEVTEEVSETENLTGKKLEKILEDALHEYEVSLEDFGLGTFKPFENVDVSVGMTEDDITIDFRVGDTYNLAEIPLDGDLGFHKDFGFYLDTEKTGLEVELNLKLSDEGIYRTTDDGEYYLDLDRDEELGEDEPFTTDESWFSQEFTLVEGEFDGAEIIFIDLNRNDTFDEDEDLEIDPELDTNNNFKLDGDFKGKGTLGFLQLDFANDPENLTKAQIKFSAQLEDLDLSEGVRFFDVDGDGNLDLNEDLNGNGILENEKDYNENGEIDSLTEDTNDNGILDPAEDLNKNGKLDLGEDKNNNGTLDEAEDTNNNGILDPGEDINNNGTLDEAEDLDNDGELDPNEDINNNGILDGPEDKNNNGNIDTLTEDVNGNGKLDPSEDKNNNGKLDAGEDTNSNGKLDLAEDKNNNNSIDNLSEDLNGNGKLESEDVDGDGKLDKAEPFTLIDPNGKFTDPTPVANDPLDTNKNKKYDEDVLNEGIYRTTASGTYYLDANRNGKLDAAEPSTTVVALKNKEFNLVKSGEQLFFDADNNGIIDETKELINSALDSNNNQKLDADIAGEGEFVNGIGIEYLDANKNGKLDKNEIFTNDKSEDRNKNGKLDVGEDLNDNDELDLVNGFPDISNENSTAELEQYLDDGARLTLSEFTNFFSNPDRDFSDLFGYEFSGGANLGLKTKTSIEGDAAFPSFNMDLAVNFPLFNYGNPDEASEQGLTVGFNNLQLDFGTFITEFAQPLFKKINELLEPIRPIVDFLNKDTGILIKVFSQYDRKNQGGNADGKLSLLELISGLVKEPLAKPIFDKIGINVNTLSKSLETISKVTRLFTQIDAVIREIASIPEGETITLDFGSYSLDDIKGASTDKEDAASQVEITGDNEEQLGSTPPTTPVEEQAENSSGGSIFDKLQNIDGLEFQFLNPITVIRILLGEEDVDLVTFDVPDINLEFKYEQEAPLGFIPPGITLEGKLGASFNLNSNLTFGFDTHGLEQWQEADYSFEDSYKIFDGLYLKDGEDTNGNGKIDPQEDTDELTMKAAFQLGIAASAVIAKVTGYGGIEGTAGLDFVDEGELNGQGDGKIRPSEIINKVENAIDNSSSFTAILQDFIDLSGKIEAFFGVEVKVGVKIPLVGEVMTTVYEQDLGRIPLIEFTLADLLPSPLDENESESETNLPGGFDNDLLNGTAGNDTLNGNDGDDTLKGLEGNDSLLGGKGNDNLDAAGGDDTLEGIYGDDSLLGGLGNDLLKGGDGNDKLTGDNGDDQLQGDAGNDTLDASAGSDYLLGGLGNDQLLGSDGNDTLLGNEGDDLLNAGKGYDNLNGGKGKDLFLFETKGDAYDTILDFNIAEGDKIQISKSGFGISNLEKFSFNNGILTFDGQNLVLIENNNAVVANFSISAQITLV
jgi:Ca2+-binding RTX toxin-like protein